MADPWIPGYRIVGPLGAGGMASVYLAVQESLDREVALKVMTPASAANQEFAQRFVKEGRITARLNHPHLLTVFDIGQHGAIYYLAAEYLPGGTLSDKLDRGINVAESLDVACDIARGLHFAHEAGFVHRDVKPSNVLFRANGEAVLADFGIAKAMDGMSRVTQVGSLIGTPRYMSPEQVNAQDLDGRSDLYSLGVVLFELLTGKPPYDAADPLSIALMHIAHPVPQLPPATAWLQPLVNGLMAKDAGQRFAHGEAFVAAVARLLAETPDGMVLQHAPEARQRTPPRISLTDLQRPALPTPVPSAALPAARDARRVPVSSSPQAQRRYIVMAALVAALLVLGAAAAWQFFRARASLASVRTEAAQIEAARIEAVRIEAARIEAERMNEVRADERCRAALALVTTAVSQADLARAEMNFAAIPAPCSARHPVSQAREDLSAAAARAAAARNQVQAWLDRGDLPAARTALAALERIDRSANELPGLRSRLEQLQKQGAGEQQAIVTPAPQALPQAPPQKETVSKAGQRGPTATASLPRPDAQGAAPARRPAANPPVQNSQKCRDISLRAGLGEETAEERRYLSENCR